MDNYGGFSKVQEEPQKIKIFSYSKNMRGFAIFYESWEQSWIRTKTAGRSIMRKTSIKSGYPDGLKDKDIPKETRIVAVCDVVEAMSFHRPYRAKIKIENIVQELDQYKGEKYDREICEIVLNSIKNGEIEKLLMNKS